MTHDETKAEIEAEIAQERNALADSLNQLTSQLSPENLVNSVGDTLKAQSHDLADTVVRGAKDNPAALALVGAGLAWLLMSKSGGTTTAARTTPAAPVGYDTRPYDPAPGFRNSADDPDAFRARVAAAEAALRQPHEADDPSMLDQAKAFVRRTAADMRATLYDGTAELNDMARARVIEARRKAIAAQDRFEHHRRKARGRGRSFFDDNPLLVGAGIAAVGAAAAMAMPRTKMEDDAFGSHRDALMAEADRVLHEEMSRAKAMAYAAMDEAEKMAQEAVESVPSGDEAVARAEAKMRHAGERIADRAREAKTH